MWFPLRRLHRQGRLLHHDDLAQKSPALSWTILTNAPKSPLLCRFGPGTAIWAPIQNSSFRVQDLCAGWQKMHQQTCYGLRQGS
jgi:hypothetical protein